MRKGSVTLFLSLVLVLVMSFLFSLLEGARVFCLRSRAQTVTEQCMQSLFGNYQAGLWEDYHLLFLDGSWQEGEFSMNRLLARGMEEVRQNLSYRGEALGQKGWEFVNLALGAIEFSHYQLATDNDGQVFQSQVALQMQLEAAADVLEELKQLREDSSEVKEQTEQKEDRWEQAWEAMDEAEEIKKQQEEGTGGDEGDAGDQAGASGAGVGESDAPAGSGVGVGESDVPAASGTDMGALEESAAQELENPMEYVKELKSSTVLGLVAPDPSQISGKAVAGGDFLEDRRLNQGNWTKQAERGLLDRLWLQYYIQNYFSNFVESSEKGAQEKVLDYEMEYLLAGGKDDSQNLEKVVYELLGIREVMNFLTILQDSGKKAMALTIATATVGFTGIVPLINAVQIGVLLAWAFVESVLDIRSLLAGKKVPLLKRADQWSSDLTNCKATVESGAEAEEDGEGLSYTQYLQILLFLLSDRTINYRCMDLIERNEQIRMDHMIQAVEGSFSYEAEPLFWNFNLLAGSSWDTFAFPVPAEMTYGASG